MVKRLFLYFFFSVISIALFGQEHIRFRNFSVSSGLSQNTITSITQDKAGFMWFGTQDGLNRFDGYNFRVFRNSESDSNTLSNNYIISLTIDSAGFIWASTTNGLNFINPLSGKVSRVDFGRFMMGYKYRRTTNLVPSVSGGVFFLSNGKLLWADTSVNCRFIAHPQGMDIYQIVSAGKNIVVRTKDKVWLYNPETAQWKSTEVMLAFGSIIHYANETFFIYEQEGSLYRYFFSGSVIVPFFPNQVTFQKTKKVHQVLVDNQSIWICTENGLIFQNGADTLVIKHDPDYKYSITSDFTYQVFKDRDGRYWIGTARGGLCYFDTDWMKFKVIGANLGVRAAVWHVVEKGDTCIMATAKGIRCFLKKKNTRIGQSFVPEHILKEIFIPSLQNQLKDFLVSSLCLDGNGNLWSGTENQGLLKYDFQSGKTTVFYHHPGDSTSLTSNSIMHLVDLSGDEIGASTPYGFNFINERTGKIRQLKVSRLNKNVANNYIMYTLPVNNTLWFCTSDGLLKYENGKLKQYLPDSKNISEQYHNIVTSVYIDRKGTIWVASFGYGLNKFDSKTETFKHYGRKRGLSNENVLGITEDVAGKLWISTHDGIFQFDKEKEHFFGFSEKDGLESRECTENSIYRSSNGDIYVGTVGGLIAFDPALIISVRRDPSVTITDIQINYQSIQRDPKLVIRDGSFYSPRKILLTSDMKSFAVSFASLIFSNAERVIYRYKLDGFDEKWIVGGPSSRLASYTSLPSGKYKLIISCSLDGINWTTKPLSIEIEVTPPFYLTWWFIVLAVLFLIAVVFLSARFYYLLEVRKQRRIIEQERRIRAEKERIGRELHDNVGSQLTYLIKSLDTLAYKTRSENQIKTEKLDELSNFGRETLNHLRDSIWAINSGEISLAELKARIQNFCDRINAALDNNIISVSQDNSGNSEIKLNPSVAMNIYRITQEAINNAVKYSGATKIRFEMIRQGHSLDFIVSDDGSGFKPGEDKSTGYGLKNMKDRAIESGLRYNLMSEKGKGTTILIQLELN